MKRDVPESAECVIIGGGVVGCSLAYHLTQLGMTPVLLERDVLGGGSTGRCAGGVRQQFATEINVKVGMMSREMLANFENEIGVTSGYKPIGYLFLASNDAEAEQFRRNVAMQQAAGLSDVKIVTPEEIAEIVPGMKTDDVVLGAFCQSDGLAGPNEVTTGYAAAARRNGATILEGCDVETIKVEARRSGGRVTGVTLNGNSIATEMVINCAGPHAGYVGEMAGVDVPVKPYRRHIFVTEPIDLPAIPMTVEFQSSLYFHPEGEGLLLGMSDPDEPSSFDTAVDWTFLEKLVARAVERYPKLEQAGIARGWAGLYEVSPDRQAIAGQSDVQGFWMCCGFSGHGFMQAPAMGKLLAQVICGKKPDIDISAFSPSRFREGKLQPEAQVI